MKIGASTLLLLAAVLGAPASASASGSLATAPIISPAADAYHFGDWADGRHDWAYNEWWYFNLLDARQEIRAIFTYFIADPGDRTKQGLAQIVAVAYTPAGVTSAVDLYPPDRLSASYTRADVAIEGNAIQVIDADTYRIVGATRDGRLAWDLTYARLSAPWLALDRARIGRLSWEWMSWLVYMPRAAVSGQLIVDGRAYAVEGSGYHDHNWGEWVFGDGLWNWAQCSAPGLSFGLGDFIGGPTGVAALELDGQRMVFTKDEYRLLHTRWAYDARNRKRYPVESVFFAENAATRLLVTLVATATEAIRGDAPAPLADPIIYEQTARYEGWLWRRGARGRWHLATSFRGGGFKEFTATSHR